MRVPIGTWTLLVRHKDLTDPAKQQAFLQQHGPRASELMFHEVQQLEVVTGPTKELSIQLPRTAGYGTKRRLREKRGAHVARYVPRHAPRRSSAARRPYER